MMKQNTFFPAGLENKPSPGLQKEKCFYSLSSSTLGRCHKKLIPNSPTLHLSWNVTWQICNSSSREGEKSPDKPAAVQKQSQVKCKSCQRGHNSNSAQLETSKCFHSIRFLSVGSKVSEATHPPEGFNPLLWSTQPPAEFSSSIFPILLVYLINKWAPYIDFYVKWHFLIMNLLKWLRFSITAHYMVPILHCRMHSITEFIYPHTICTSTF